ncbi:MAG: nucleoside phosphorylase domain-containing protein, partial [Olpidium bornovanus]
EGNVWERGFCSEPSSNSAPPAAGRTYHVNTRSGEVANRIIPVGDPARAKRIAGLLDNPEQAFSHFSGRQFLTITGTYKGVPVSLVAIGMGIANVDFFVRECRAVVRGPMAVIRLGSCGAIDKSTRVGQVVVPDRAVAVTRNYDYFNGYLERGRGRDGEAPYVISLPEAADAELTAALAAEMSRQVGAGNVVTGLDVATDSFYCSQGRTGDAFYDDNGDLFETIRARHPEAVSMEMEDHTIFHLANSARPMPGFDASVRSIRAAAAMIVFADRTSNEFISAGRVAELESATGAAVLEAVTKCDLGVDGSKLHPTEGSVWERSGARPDGTRPCKSSAASPFGPIRRPARAPPSPAPLPVEFHRVGGTSNRAALLFYAFKSQPLKPSPKRIPRLPASRALTGHYS